MFGVVEIRNPHAMRSHGGGLEIGLNLTDKNGGKPSENNFRMKDCTQFTDIFILSMPSLASIKNA